MGLILDGKRVKCASGFDELKTRHYQRIVKEWEPEEKDLYKKDFFKLFCILTDTDYAKFVKTPENELLIWNAVRWYVETPFLVDSKPPLVFNLGTKWLVIPRKIRVPKSAGGLSPGQEVKTLDHIRAVKYTDEAISIAAAIALQPLYDEAPFDYQRAKELENIILEMPIVKTYPLGFFLLMDVSKRGMKRIKSYNQIRNNPVMRFVNKLQNLLVWTRLQSGKSIT